MALITYEDKIALNENSQIADNNKVTASDMNEIKDVVNENSNDYNNYKNDKKIIKQWENDNSEISFSPQNITITNTNYDYLIIVFRTHKDSDYNSTNSIFVPYAENRIINLMSYQSKMNGNAKGMYNRFITITSKNILNVAGGVNLTNFNTPSATNDCCIPLEIYTGKF